MAVPFNTSKALACSMSLVFWQQVSTSPTVAHSSLAGNTGPRVQLQLLGGGLLDLAVVTVHLGGPRHLVHTVGHLLEVLLELDDDCRHVVTAGAVTQRVRGQAVLEQLKILGMID